MKGWKAHDANGSRGAGGWLTVPGGARRGGGRPESVPRRAARLATPVCVLHPRRVHVAGSSVPTRFSRSSETWPCARSPPRVVFLFDSLCFHPFVPCHEAPVRIYMLPTARLTSVWKIVLVLFWLFLKMDYQNAMEIFSEAWMAANAKGTANFAENGLQVRVMRFSGEMKGFSSRIWTGDFDDCFFFLLRKAVGFTDFFNRFHSNVGFFTLDSNYDDRF